MSTSDTRSGPDSADLHSVYAQKWKAFSAIGISFFIMVMSMSMVFLALEAIAQEFDVTLRTVVWVVIAQALTISALMMPMGRLADIIGRKKVHLIGLVFFAAGAIFTAIAPVFGLLIFARVIMAIGNAMSQSVGTAMVISVFPPAERGKAIGSQTTAVAVGGAVGPALAGLLLEFLPWQALFLVLVPPIAIAFIAGYIILDETVVSDRSSDQRDSFDWPGAILSGTMIILGIILINNPSGQSWGSPIMIGTAAAVVVLFGSFVSWELRTTAPMLQLRLFTNKVFSLAVLTRYLGFVASTAAWMLTPIYLISSRDISPGQAGSVLLLSAVGMAIAAQMAGRLSDRYSERPLSVFGFTVLMLTSAGFITFGHSTSLWIVALVLFVNGLGMGFWGVPNNNVIMGSVHRSSYGVVGAFSNLTRNVGSVTGQAVATAIVVGVMVSNGFDIPLNEISELDGADKAFIDGWRIAFALVAAVALVGAVLSLINRPSPK